MERDYALLGLYCAAVAVMVIFCSGFWMAGYRAWSLMAFAAFAPRIALEMPGQWSIGLWPDEWLSIWLVTDVMVAFGVVGTILYSLLIYRHLLFYKTMPWAGQKK